MILKLKRSLFLEFILFRVIIRIEILSYFKIIFEKYALPLSDTLGTTQKKYV